MPTETGLRLDQFNSLETDDAVSVLLACCASPTWARAVAAARPFSSRDALYARADEALAALSESDIDDALAGHPRIGERAAGDGHSSELSQKEQAGVAGSDEQTLRDLAEANRAYEERFDHVYLVLATGKTAPEMLQILRERMRNSPEEERRVLREELAKINRIRLDRLIA